MKYRKNKEDRCIEKIRDIFKYIEDNNIWGDVRENVTYTDQDIIYYYELFINNKSIQRVQLIYDNSDKMSHYEVYFNDIIFYKKARVMSYNGVPAYIMKGGNR